MIMNSDAWAGIRKAAGDQQRQLNEQARKEFPAQVMAGSKAYAEDRKCPCTSFTDNLKNRAFALGWWDKAWERAFRK